MEKSGQPVKVTHTGETYSTPRLPCRVPPNTHLRRRKTERPERKETGRGHAARTGADTRRTGNEELSPARGSRYLPLPLPGPVRACACAKVVSGSSQGCPWAANRHIARGKHWDHRLCRAARRRGWRLWERGKKMRGPVCLARGMMGDSQRRQYLEKMPVGGMASRWLRNRT